MKAIILNEMKKAAGLWPDAVRSGRFLQEERLNILANRLAMQLANSDNSVQWEAHCTRAISDAILQAYRPNDTFGHAVPDQGSIGIDLAEKLKAGLVPSEPYQETGLPGQSSGSLENPIEGGSKEYPQQTEPEPTTGGEEVEYRNQAGELIGPDNEVPGPAPTNPTEPASEPAATEPASEPAATEPASEPAATEPASEPAATEPTNTTAPEDLAARPTPTASEKGKRGPKKRP